jgi:hypothetical protein
LWLAADKLRNNMDAAEYMHVVLGLIFLKYISDSFEEHHAKHAADQGDYRGANPEDPDVLMLAGRHVFCIEVETTIDCIRRIGSLRRSLLQLRRFRLFQDAISTPPTSKWGRRAIVGRTLNDQLDIRRAKVNPRGHGVLSDLGQRLQLAGKEGNDHYAL